MNQVIDCAQPAPFPSSRNDRGRSRSARGILLALCLAACSLSGCGEKEDPNAAPVDLEPVVMTTFSPTTWMVRTIAQGAVPVRCPLPEGEDAIFWKPSAEVIQAYQRARLVVVNGAEFEKWVATTSLPQSRVVVSTKGQEERFVHFETTTHSHGPEGEHSHEGVDGHTWMDPILAKAQASTIAAAMTRSWPEHAATFTKGLREVHAVLDALDARLKALTPQVQKFTVLCSHPAYNYLARRYGWKIKNFDFDPEGDLTKEALARLTLSIARGKPTLLLWESTPKAATAELVKNSGIANVVFEPLENRGEKATDYAAEMNANLDRLKAAVSAKR